MNQKTCKSRLEKFKVRDTMAKEKDKALGSFPVTCELCKTKLMSAQEQIEHEFSLMHHIKLDQLKEGKWIHRCDLCAQQLGGLPIFISHMHGKKHQKVLASQKEIWLSKPPVAPMIPTTFFFTLNNNKKNDEMLKLPKHSSSNTSSGSSSVKELNSLSKPKERDGASNSRPSNTSSNCTSSDKSRDRPKGTDLANYHRGKTASSHRSNSSFDRIKDGRSQFEQFRFNFDGSNNNSHWENRSGLKFNNNRANYHENRPMEAQPPYYHQNNNSYWNYNNNYNPHNMWRNNWNNANYPQNVRPADGWPHNNTFIPNHPPPPLPPPSSSSNYNNYLDFNGQPFSETNSRAFKESIGPDSEPKTRSKEPESTKPNMVKDKKGMLKNTPKVATEKGTKSNSKTHVEKEAPKKDNKMPNVPKEGFKKNSKEKDGSKKSSKNSTEKDSLKNKPKTTGEKIKNELPDSVGAHKKDAKEPGSQKSKGKKSDSKKKRKSHLYFVSSDSHDTSEEEDSAELPSAPPLGKIKVSKRLRIPISSLVNENVLKTKEDYNKSLISRLVNHPCTRKQQLQLTRWIRDHTRSREKLILPRFNLPLGGDSENAEGDAEMKIIVSDVISEFPEDVIVSLFEAINQDPTSSSEHTLDRLLDDVSDDENFVDRTEEGNLPWAAFLKSLSESDPVSYPKEDPKQKEVNVSVAEDMVSSTNICHPVQDENSGDVNQNSYMKIRIKDEPVDEEPEIIRIDDTSSDSTEAHNIPSSSMCPNVEELEELLLPYKVKSETGKDAPPKQSSPFVFNMPLRTSPLASSSIRNSDESLSPKRISSPKATPYNAPPSLNSSSSIEQTQEDFSSWLNDIEISNIVSEKDNTPLPSVSTTRSDSPQSVVSQLLALSTEEDQLRDQTQKVEQMITQLYRLLEEWKTKRNEIMQEELRLRTKRMKLLETLQGGFVSKNDSPIETDSSSSKANTTEENPPNSVTYLGTLDQTWELIQQIGASIGMTGGGLGINESQTVINESSNSTLDSETTKKGKRKSKDSDKQMPGPSSKKLKKIPKENSKKKPKKKSDKKSVEEPIDEAALSASVIQKLMASIALPNIPSSNSTSATTSSRSKDAENPPKLPVFLGSDDDEEEESLNQTFGPIAIHNSAVIDIKVSKGLLYTCSSDTTAKCIDIKDPTKIIVFAEHKKTVSAIQVTTSEGGKAYIFTASHDGYLRCFDTQTGECINQLNAQDPIICMAKGWGKLFIGLQNGDAVPYSITSSKFLESITCSQAAVSRIVTCAEGAHRLLCIASYDGSVTLRNATTGLLVRVLAGKVRPPCCIQVDVSQIYTSTADKIILVHDLTTGTLIRTVRCPSSATGLFVHGDYVLSSSYDGFIRCYRKKDWALNSIYYSAGKTKTLCMEVSNNWIFTGNRDGIVEAFQSNHSSTILCKFQNCSNFPFGRAIDLVHHLKEDHLEEANHFSKCPWRGCDSVLLGSSELQSHAHIISHCELGNRE